MLRCICIRLCFMIMLFYSLQYSSYDSVTAMLSNLGWCSLEYRSYDSRFAMFYKIQYSLVAVQMPSYFERPKRITRQYNPLGFRQVFDRIDYYRCSFYPITIVLWKGTSRQRSGKGAIRKRFPLQKPRWEKAKLTIRYLYHETYRKPNEQLFSQ